LSFNCWQSVFYLIYYNKLFIISIDSNNIIYIQNPTPNDLYLEHIRNATEESPKCIQKNIFDKNVTLEGSEDCLHLNVYRPKVI